MSSCNVAFNAKWIEIFHNLFIKMRCRDVVFTNTTVGFVCLDNQFNSFKYPNRRFLMTMLNPCRLNWNFLLSSIFKWKLQISFFGTKCEPYTLLFALFLPALHSSNAFLAACQFAFVFCQLNCFECVCAMHKEFVFVTSKQVTLLELHIAMKVREKRKKE